MEKIKILHIGMSREIGGIEKYLITVFKNIDRNKYDFSFLSNPNSEMAFQDEIIKYGGHIFKTKEKRNRFFNKKYHKELSNIFLKNAFDVVEMHLIDLYNIDPIIIAKKFHVPIRIIHSHASANWSKPSLFVRMNIYKNKLVYKHYSSINIACSCDAAKFFFKNNKHVEIINNGIEAKAFFYDDKIRIKYRERIGISKDTIVFCTVGRLHAIKNHKYLIYLFNEYLKFNDNSTLLIAGVGSELLNLQGLVQKLKIEKKVLFLGFLDDVNELYNASDYFISTSFSESYSIVLYEALFTGLTAFISFDTCCVSKLINKLNINDTPQESAKKILGILPQNPRKSMILEDYSIERTIKQLDYVYQSNK